MLNKSADDSIIEVVNMFPFDPFQNVLFLLGLQCQLNKHLLQFLVAVIYDELLKAVVIEDLKAVDVQNSHNFLLPITLCLHNATK